VLCTKCGRQNPPDSHFCAHCGNPLTGAGGETPAETTSTIALQAVDAEHDDEHGGEDAAAVEGLPTGSALLVVKRGPNAGSRFLLDKDVTTAGRHPESDIFLDDVTVSRRHAEFRRDGGRFTVRDVGSLNGTYLNRERIDDTELSGGDEVQIGKFRLVFFAGPRQGSES
jgi:pSer/pThr/pTyr-binding forkhead associated (FHA) protein